MQALNQAMAEPSLVSYSDIHVFAAGPPDTSNISLNLAVYDQLERNKNAVRCQIQ